MASKGIESGRAEMKDLASLIGIRTAGAVPQLRRIYSDIALSILREHGIPWERVTRETNIKRKELEGDFIDVWVHNKLIGWADGQIDGFHIKQAEACRISSFGPLIWAITSAENWKMALAIISLYQPLFDKSLQMEAVENSLGGEFILRYPFQDKESVVAWFFAGAHLAVDVLDSLLATNYQKGIKAFIHGCKRTKFVPDWVDFSFIESDEEPYMRLFLADPLASKQRVGYQEAELAFVLEKLDKDCAEAGFGAIKFTDKLEAAITNWPLMRTEEKLPGAAELVKYCYPRQDVAWVEKQLNKEGTTAVKIRRKGACYWAAHLLRTTSMTNIEINAITLEGEIRNFGRAIEKETGYTVQEWRAIGKNTV